MCVRSKRRPGARGLKGPSLPRGAGTAPPTGPGRVTELTGGSDRPGAPAGTGLARASAGPPQGSQQGGPRLLPPDSLLVKTSPAERGPGAGEGSVSAPRNSVGRHERGEAPGPASGTESSGRRGASRKRALLSLSQQGRQRVCTRRGRLEELGSHGGRPTRPAVGGQRQPAPSRSSTAPPSALQSIGVLGQNPDATRRVTAGAPWVGDCLSQVSGESQLERLGQRAIHGRRGHGQRAQGCLRALGPGWALAGRWEPVGASLNPRPEGLVAGPTWRGTVAQEGRARPVLGSWLHGGAGSLQSLGPSEVTGSPSVPHRWPEPRVQEDPDVRPQEAGPRRPG